MAIQYRSMNLDTDKRTLVSFYQDTQFAATGRMDLIDEEAYLKRLRARSAAFPGGYVLAEEDGQPIGQLELQIQSHGRSRVGYIGILYLIPSCRGKGYSSSLLSYSEQWFFRQGMKEYHLRVDQGNRRAIRFYEKNGLRILKDELNSMGDPCYRMGKELDFESGSVI